MKLKFSWISLAGALLLAACGQNVPAPTASSPAVSEAPLSAAPGVSIPDGDLTDAPSGTGGDAASTLTTGSVPLKVGQTHQFNVTVNGRVAYAGELIWTSSNTTVARVSSTGFVTTRAAGTARIRAALTKYPTSYLDFHVSVTSTVTTAPAPTPATGTSPSTFEQQVLQLTNQARAQGRTCGTQYYPPAAPLAYNAQLRTAAYGHARDMAIKTYFSHTGLDGRSPFDRMRAAAYYYRTAGENIAAGQTTASTVVNAWLQSPGHCRNIMNAGFRELGVGYYAGGSYRHYWAQNFGARY